MDTPTSTPAPTPLRTKPTLLERVLWKAALKSIKLLMSIWIFTITHVRKRPLAQRPTYTKYYPARPDLVNHVWIPEGYKAGEGRLLPLLIDVHGGGFCIGHPFVDDRDCAVFCREFGICVVSVGYRKAPEHPFPTAPHDVAALITAILTDPTLPIDRTRTALIGYSAGGNLVLTAPQLLPPSLRSQIKATVAYYPVTDFARTLSMRVAKATPPPGREDQLIKMSRAFNWSYIRDRTEYEDPLLSPLYAERSALPAKLLLLGCEYDILCGEARDAAERYAGDAERVPLGEGRTGWVARKGAGGVWWEELKGLEHAYNQRWEREGKVLGPEWERRTREIHARTARWLFEEVYDV